MSRASSLLSAARSAVPVLVVSLGLACLQVACGDNDAPPVPADTATAPVDTVEADDLATPDAPDSGPAAPVGICGVLSSLCGGMTVTEPTVGQAVQVAPSDGMPPEVVSQKAHNNLDVAWFEGRLWFAFRTGPNHFADTAVVMYVVSTTDLIAWRFEGEFALGTDVREPQLVGFDGELLLYFAVLGSNPLDFEPQGVKRTTYQSPGSWTTPQDVFEPGFVPWRIRSKDDRLEVLGYTGGENVYDVDGDPLRIAWLVSDDGQTWSARVPGQPVVLEGGGSETDLAELPDGSIVAVVRNEAGDATGFGSKICRAPAEALGDWECVADPRKYDSPLVFSEGGVVYLIARRNLTETGNYDLGETDKDPADRYLSYQGAYWEAPKRCSLWTVDPQALVVEHVLDLPSKGDTCFPEALRLEAGRWLVFNYTSPYDGDDEPKWWEGQLAPTLIYYTVLSVP